MVDMERRVERLEDDIYQTHPEHPGALVRLDRIERLLALMLRVGYFLGGCGIVYKALDVVGEVFEGKLTSGS